jgi:protein-tyrosine phosphatase
VVRRMRAAGIVPGSTAPSPRALPAESLRARPETMTDFLAQLTTVFGGGAAWLRTHGLTETELDRFRESFLVD